MKNLKFAILLVRKSDKLSKKACFKTSKIGLNKCLFKKKKSAINAEFLKMVRDTVQLSD